MASIHPYRTARGERRYDVRYRDQHGRQRSQAFSAHKDALAFKVDVERGNRAGIARYAGPEKFCCWAGVG
jgi:hypothetical protein